MQKILVLPEAYTLEEIRPYLSDDVLIVRPQEVPMMPPIAEETQPRNRHERRRQAAIQRHLTQGGAR